MLLIELKLMVLTASDSTKKQTKQLKSHSLGIAVDAGSQRTSRPAVWGQPGGLSCSERGASFLFYFQRSLKLREE